MAPPVFQVNEDQMLTGDMDYQYKFAERWATSELEPDSTMYDDSNPGSWTDVDTEKPKTYTVLESSASSQSSLLSSSELSSSDESSSIPSTVMQYMPCLQAQDSLDDWRYKHPQRWTKTEVMGFLHYFGELAGFDIRNFYGERFQDVTGERLCAMSKEDLLRREPNYGHDIYTFLRRTATEIKTPSSAYLEGSSTSPMFSIPPFTDDDGYDENDFWKMGEDTVEFDDQPDTLDVKIGPHTYSLNPNPKSFENLPLIMQPVTTGQQAYQVPGLRDSFDSFESQRSYGSYAQQQPMHSYYATPSSRPTLLTKIKNEDGSKSRRVQMKPKRKPRLHKRSFNSSSSDDNSDNEIDIKPKRGKGNRLWEFIAGLLKNSQCNPRVIKWEDKANCIFRIVQSETVANMWGGKKNNEHMTYEKLSRALRFSRTAGYFADVPKDGRYPKKLCFKFGDRAIIDF